MKGRKPEGYTEPPALDIKTALYLSAFYEICRGRRLLSEGQPAPLDLGNVKQYLDFYGEPGELDEFVDVVFALDEVYVKDLYRKIKIERKKSASGSRSDNPRQMPQRR